MTEPTPAAMTTADERSLIAFRDVSVVVADGGGTRRVIDGLSLEVGAGELVAVMGPSGSGKSTMLGLCVGLSRADDGTVELAGHPVPRAGHATLAAMRRTLVGYVEQRHNLLPLLSAIDNVGLPLELNGMASAQVLIEARAALDDVGLAAQAEVEARRLSGGEQQRVAIARALVGTRRILVADEPTASLDSASGEVIMKLLRRRCDESGAAVLMATHDARHAAWADRVVYLRDGALMDEVRSR